MPHTVLIVDDHPVFRQGLRLLLGKEKDLKVVGEAGDGAEAILRAKDLSPDIVVMDINMPNLDGTEATRQILSESPHTRVVALSVHSGKRFVRGMLQAGAAGYILKESVPEEMILGIRKVLAGDVYLSQAISGVLVSDYKTFLSGTEQPDQTPSEPILRTKLHRPTISADIIPRPHLIERLEEGRHKPMTLISAPAGYGKSILMGQWLESCGRPGAWLSLDENESDLRMFLTYLLEALQNVLPSADLQTKTFLQADNLPPVRVLTHNLLNDLEQAKEPFILVLDDYHYIRENEVHDLLTELLRYPSPLLHLALLTRRDPPLPIGSLRAGNRLTEITIKDLRFSIAETRIFLERLLRFSIDENTASVLSKKVEGWVTGLRLFALSVGQKDDLLDTIHDFKQGTYSFVQEYLIQEVLSRIPPALVRYLLITSILDRFCAPLCDALYSLKRKQTESEDEYNGQSFIDWLEKTHLFVIPLDEAHRWFRYHRLFQDLLQDQLGRQSGREKILELHSRASEWFAENALIGEALQHALAAGDSVRAAEILERNRFVEENHDRWHIVGRWLDLLPSEIIQQRPKLLLAQAWQRFNQFRFLEIPPLLERVHSIISDTTVDESVLGELDFHWGYLEIWVHGDGAGAMKRLESAKKRLSQEQRVLAVETEFDLALARYMIGEGESVIESLDEGIRATNFSDDLLMTRLVAAQAFIHLMAGDLPRAARAAQQIRSYVEDGRNIDVVGWSHYLQALANLQSYRLDDALQGFLVVVEHRRIVHRKATIDALVGLPLTYRAMGKMEDSMDAVKQLMEFVQEMGDPQMVDVAEACRARLALLMGDIESASRWAQSFEAEPQAIGAFFWLEVPLITQTRVQIEMGTRESLERALESLDSLKRQGTALHLTCLMIEVRVLQSLALERKGRTDEAQEALEEAVILAQPGGWIRPFVEAGPPLAGLLDRLLQNNIAVDYIRKILAAFEGDDSETVPDAVESEPDLAPSVRPQPLIEPLTNRELDVLELIGQRLQNKEIAEKLFISAETVKGHLRNIYQKLGVSNRREAVVTAKDLGILARS